MTGIPSVLLLFHYFHNEITVTVTDYLEYGLVQCQETEIVVSDIYRTHLKHGQCLQPISFNNIGPSIGTCGRCGMGYVYYK